MAWSYKVGSETVTLAVDPSVIAVRFRGQPQRGERAAIAEASGTGPFSRRFEVPGEKLTIVPVRPTAADGGVNLANAMHRALASLNARADVANAQPVFRVGRNRVVAPSRVAIGLNDPQAAAAIVQAHGLTVLRQSAEKLVCDIPEGANVFAAANAIGAMPGVRYAEPDLITIGRHLPKRAEDANLPPLPDPVLTREQYALQLTGARVAWELQAGKPDITIAVLDEGVDSTHPDLARAVRGTFDATDGDSYQEPNPWDGHGTCCAGLAAAAGAPGIGVRGVGAGCSVLAVRIASAKYPQGFWVTSNEIIANAIDWSWRNGADVLSNSWGGGTPSNSVIEAFEAARSQGRGGRGCVIVVAAGNDFGPVSFPGSLPIVLTVAASNEFDEAKTPTSADGETWWGTNHGAAVDVAAPGVHNLTTDIQAAGGYGAGNYIGNFNGTSSATPLVAGACALVLCANPALNEGEVRAIVIGTADRVGQFPYETGRNDYFGRGRLNVLRAVQHARATTPVA